MALQVWLPLNGNLNNYGVTELVVSGTPSYIDGKMGKSLSLASKVTFTGLPKLTQFSVTFWAKVDSCAADWADLIGFKSVQAGGASASDFRFEATKTTRSCSFHNNTPYAITQASEVLITEAQKGTWHHCCFAYSGAQCFIYVDGVHKYTHTGLGGYIIDRFHIGETGNMVGGMNDLRIYDECLSLKQIKELSKGLALHFPLKVDGQPNMFTNSDTFGGWSIASGWTQGTAEDGARYLKYTRTGATANTWNRAIPSLKITPSNYPQGVTVSFDFKCDDLSVLNQKCICATQSFTSDGARVGWHEPGDVSRYSNWDKLENGKWQRISITFTQGQLAVVSSSSGYASTDISYATISFQLTQNGTIYIKNIKCEPGTINTPWNNGNNFDYHIECSGNGQNGLMGGTISYSDDTPRYTNCANLKGTSYIYNIPSVLNSTSEEFSIAFWFKLTGTQNGGFYNNRTAVGTGVSIFLLNTNQLRFDTGEAAQWNPGVTVSTNTWYHLCAIRNSSGKKIYINGVLEASTTAPGVVTTIGTHASIGASSHNGGSHGGNQLQGCMSDFRLYTTALTDTDVLSLYKTGGQIDNNGNAFAYDFIEEE